MNGGKGFDLEKQLQADAQTFRQLNGKGVSDVSGGAVLEYTLWGLSILSVVGMVLVLPWVGADKLIPGTVWLGYSLACILLFGTLAGLVRWVRETGDDLDRGMNRRFDVSRGR